MNQEMPVFCSRVISMERTEIFPKHVGIHANQLLKVMTSTALRLCGGYQSDRWPYWEVSNGTFYIACGEQHTMLKVSNLKNGYKGMVSADAVGVSASLLAFEKLAVETKEQVFRELSEKLKEYAMKHPEAEEIFKITN